MDQREQIVLDVDETPAIQGAAKANAALDSVEKKAGRVSAAASTAVEAEGRRIVSITDRSRNAIERMVASAEKKASSAGLDPVARLQQERDQLIRRISGDAQGVDRVRAAYEKLIGAQRDQAAGVRAIADAVRNPFQAASSAVEGFLGKFGVIGAVAAGAAVGIGLAAKAAFDLVTGAGAAAEQTVNLADVMGITAGEASVLEAQARIAGVGVDSLVGVVRKLSDTLTDGGEASRQAVSTLERMGITVVKSSGGFRDSISILRDFSKQIDKMPDHAHKISLLNDVFGKGSIALLPLIEHFDELDETARRLGSDLDGDLKKQLAAVDDKFDEMGISWDRLKLKLAEKLVVTVEFVTSILGPGAKVLSTLQNGGAAAFGGAAANVAGQRLGLSTSGIQFKPPTPSSDDGVESSLRDQLRRVAAGNALVDQFRSRKTQESLQAQLQDILKNQQGIGATIQRGITGEVASGAIARFDILQSQAESLKKQIKDLEEIPGKLKALGDAIPKAKADLLGASKQGAESGVAEALKLRAEYSDAVKGNAKAQEQLNQLVDLSIRKSVLENLHAQADALNEQVSARRKFEGEQFTRGLDFANQTGGINLEAIKSRFEFEDTIAAQTRDSELRGLEAFNAVTISDKIAVEQQKAEIDARYLSESLGLRVSAIDRENDSVISGLRVQLNTKLITEAQFEERRAALVGASNEQVRQLREVADDSIRAARENAGIRSSKIILDQNQKVFDSFKQSTEGVFDALLTKSQNIFQAIGNAMKTALLTAIKDIVSSRVAATLTQLVTGQHVGLQNQSLGAGPLGRILGSLGLGAKPVFGTSKLEQTNHLGDVALVRGAVPVYIMNAGSNAAQSKLPGIMGALAGLGGVGGLFGGGSGSGGFATSESISFPDVAGGASKVNLGGGTGIFGSNGLGGLLGGPGGTSGFSGPVGKLIGGGGQAASGAGGIRGALGMLPGGGLAAGSLIPSLALGGSALGLMGAFKAGQSDNKILKGFAPAIGAVSGLVGFGALASFFPALIAAGPVGWIAAAGIGAAIGLIGILRKKAESKIVDRVKAVYGITIPASFAKDPLLGIIKQNFGGNVDVGIRSPQIRELLELYAMTTGQNSPAGLVPRVTASTFANQGGSLTQMPTFTNGLPSLSASAVSAGPTIINVTVPGAKDFFTKETVQVIANNPRTVSSSNVQGQRASVGRRSGAANMLNPSFITA